MFPIFLVVPFVVVYGTLRKNTLGPFAAFRSLTLLPCLSILSMRSATAGEASILALWTGSKFCFFGVAVAAEGGFQSEPVNDL